MYILEKGINNRSRASSTFIAAQQLENDSYGSGPRHLASCSSERSKGSILNAKDKIKNDLYNGRAVRMYCLKSREDSRPKTNSSSEACTVPEYLRASKDTKNKQIRIQFRAYSLLEELRDDEICIEDDEEESDCSTRRRSRTSQQI
jgi:hypothetical protein